MRRIAALLLFASSLVAAERGRLEENVATRADTHQTYTLYLPATYEGTSQHAVLLVFDPHGKGTAGATLFREAAEELGWIVISSNGTRSGENEVNEKALRALVPELTRYRVAPGRVYAAGFSGTAMLAWQLGISTGLLHGVIGVGGRNMEEIEPARFSFAHYGFAGHIDFNNREMREVDALLERAGKTHRFEDFAGVHRWITPALARDALGWFEALAMKEGRRAKDEALLAKLQARDAEAANALEVAGRKLDALRRYRAIALTFDSADARAAVARLEKDGAVARELEDEMKWDDYERAYQREVIDRAATIFARVRDEEPVRARTRLARELRVAELQRRATRSGREGLAARRLLQAVYTQTAFTIVPRFIARGEHSLAAVTAGVATQIHPELWHAWYAEAEAYARSGNASAALKSLERAIDTGFAHGKHLAADEDFASLRGTERFRALLARIE